jgi:hypothetical protein
MLFFAVLGLLSLMVGVLTFTVLFVDMAIQGVPRLTRLISSPTFRRAAPKMPASFPPGSAPSW